MTDKDFAEVLDEILAEVKNIQSNTTADVENILEELKKAKSNMIDLEETMGMVLDDALDEVNNIQSVISTINSTAEILTLFNATMAGEGRLDKRVEFILEEKLEEANANMDDLRGKIKEVNGDIEDIKKEQDMIMDWKTALTGVEIDVFNGDLEANQRVWDGDE